MQTIVAAATRYGRERAGELKGELTEMQVCDRMSRMPDDVLAFTR
jgi:hypothetical protein